MQEDLRREPGDEGKGMTIDVVTTEMNGNIAECADALFANIKAANTVDMKVVTTTIEETAKRLGYTFESGRGMEFATRTLNALAKKLDFQNGDDLFKNFS